MPPRVLASGPKPCGGKNTTIAMNFNAGHFIGAHTLLPTFMPAKSGLTGATISDQGWPNEVVNLALISQDT